MSARKTSPRRRPLAERLAEKTVRGGPGGCWLWLGARNNRGYGIVRDEESRLTTAHRAAFVLAGGDPGSPVVRHSCDNPRCVNPAHLKAGTGADNMADMVRRGRSCRGARNGSAMLDDADVREIRGRLARGETQRYVGAVYGIRQPTVSDIATGRTWAHVA